LLGNVLSDILLAHRPHLLGLTTQEVKSGLRYTLSFCEKILAIPVEMTNNMKVNKDALMQCFPLKALLEEALSEDSEINTSLLAVRVIA